MLIGGFLWGVVGMLLSILLTAIINVIFDRTESLNIWGILLGDKMTKTNKTGLTERKN